MMKFTVDKQTLDDLNLLGRFKNKSVFSLFNKALTSGGDRLLHEMFNNPLIDPVEINRKSAEFQYFQERGYKLSIDPTIFSEMEAYVHTGGKGGWLESAGGVVRRYLLHMIGLNEEYEMGLKGIHCTSTILLGLSKMLFQQLDGGNNPFEVQIKAFLRLPLIKKLKPGPYSLSELIELDYFFRHVYQEQIVQLLKLVYQIDICVAVAQTAIENDLTYAVALPKESQVLSIYNCRYPGLEKAIGNEITLDQNSNMLFLTGANMAGKSTFMKSFGIACYLAHMGFPVAADKMIFSVKDGLYTSINVPDNINLGYSHYYAEVLRVKEVAIDVSGSRDLYIIFDELFKGTNVKDAYDATLAVTEAFAENRNCFYIISTHIIEVGKVLEEHCSNIKFNYLPTVMNGNIPQYTYKFQQGITSDRHGMMIIKNEKILEILND